MNIPQLGTPELSNEQILNSVEKGTISLSEVIQAVNEKLNKTTIGEVPLKALPTIEKMKTPVTDQEITRFNEVEEFLKNTANFRNDKALEQTLQESNGKKYLVLGDDDMFEIKEQRGDVYIAYHPIKQMYIIYKFVGEDSGRNTSLLWGLDNIEKTNIDGYYNISSTKIEMWSIVGGKPQPEKRKEFNYYYIGKGGDTKYFGDYKHVSDLKQFGNATFFKGATTNNQVFNELVIHNGEKVKKIQSGYENTRRSENGRKLLHIIYNICKPNSTNSLFDLDTMEFVFEGANEFKADINFPENDVGTFGNDISYTFYEKRKGFKKILGDKKIKTQLTL